MLQFFSLLYRTIHLLCHRLTKPARPATRAVISRRSLARAVIRRGRLTCTVFVISTPPTAACTARAILIIPTPFTATCTACAILIIPTPPTTTVACTSGLAPHTASSPLARRMIFLSPPPPFLYAVQVRCSQIGGGRTMIGPSLASFPPAVPPAAATNATGGRRMQASTGIATPQTTDATRVATPQAPNTRGEATPQRAIVKVV